MAVLAKKLRIKASGGAQQAANIYSTPGEANNNAMRVSVDGVAGYVALGSTGDARRTNGRVKKSNGTTYAILANGTPDYGYRVLTANGSFTVPTGVTVLRVTCVGGGAGGGTDYSWDKQNRYPNWSNGTNVSVTWTTGGGKTTFGSVVANGGSNISYGGTVKYHSAQSENDNSYLFLPTPGVSGSSTWFSVSQGYHSGRYEWSTGNYIEGAGAVPLTTYTGTQVATAGAGGNGDGDGFDDGGIAANGASGYRTVQTINVTPGQVIGYAIGGGGYGWWRGGQHTGGSSGGSGCGMGARGAILVEWGKGIQ